MWIFLEKDATIDGMVWDYTKEEYEKQGQADPIWKLERLITYGLEGEKLDKDALKKYLPQLRVPEDRKVFLEALLWDKTF